MNRMQIQLSDQQVEAVRRLSHDRGISVAAVVRNAVDRYVGEEPMAPRERALAYVGGFHSGRTDVSEHHDEHLAEAYA